MGRRLALLIATYEYQDAGLRRLTAPVHDAESLAGVLRDPDIAGFEVTILVNEPYHRVGEAIGDFYRDRRSDDLALLYFTGHGLKDDSGRLYLAMTDTRRGSLLFSALSAEQLDQAVTECVSRQKVLILDCCYSGAYPAGRLAKAGPEVHALERFQGRGCTVLTASDATQYSFEGDVLSGQAVPSVFTRHLVDGLRDGTADLDGDGDIALDELYSYVHDRVIEEMPQQRPKKKDNVEGRIIIARNTRWTLPSYLANAVSSPIAADRLAALDGLEHLYRIGNDMVRDRVREQFRNLAEDDSRAVSAKAVDRLRALAPVSPPDAAPAGLVAPELRSYEAAESGQATGTASGPSEAAYPRAIPPTEAPEAPGEATADHTPGAARQTTEIPPADERPEEAADVETLDDQAIAPGSGTPIPAGLGSDIPAAAGAADLSPAISPLDVPTPARRGVPRRRFLLLGGLAAAGGAATAGALLSGGHGTGNPGSATTEHTTGGVKPSATNPTTGGVQQTMNVTWQLGGFTNTGSAASVLAAAKTAMLNHHYDVQWSQDSTVIGAALGAEVALQVTAWDIGNGSYYSVITAFSQDAGVAEQARNTIRSVISKSYVR